MAVLWLRLFASPAWDMTLIPGWEAKTSHAMRPLKTSGVRARYSGWLGLKEDNGPSGSTDLEGLKHEDQLENLRGSGTDPWGVGLQK